MEVQDQSKIVKTLQQLVKLDYDAIEAYEAAIERLDDAESKGQLGIFRDDHRKHTENLGELLMKMNADVPQGPDAKRLLTKGKVVLGGLVGDKAILMAMHANEDVTNKTYEEAAKHVAGDSEMQQTLESNLQDERRHRDWIDRKLKSL